MHSTQELQKSFCHNFHISEAFNDDYGQLFNSFLNPDEVVLARSKSLELCDVNSQVAPTWGDEQRANNTETI